MALELFTGPEAVAQARLETHQSAMRMVRLDAETSTLKEANDALERSLRTFAQLKAKYDELSDQYDYVAADRSASRQVLKELRESAGIPVEHVRERVEAKRAAILTEQGLPHLIDKY